MIGFGYLMDVCIKARLQKKNLDIKIFGSVLRYVSKSIGDAHGFSISPHLGVTIYSSGQRKLKSASQPFSTLRTRMLIPQSDPLSTLFFLCEIKRYWGTHDSLFKSLGVRIKHMLSLTEPMWGLERLRPGMSCVSAAHGALILISITQLHWGCITSAQPLPRQAPSTDLADTVEHQLLSACFAD